MAERAAKSWIDSRSWLSPGINLPSFYRDPLGFLRLMQREYGDLVCLRTYQGRKYLINSPVLAKEVFHAPEGVYKQSKRARILGPVIGNGLLVSDGEQWRRQRPLVQETLTRPKVDGYLPMMVEEADAAICRWLQMQNGGLLNVTEEMERISLHIITRAMFGGTGAEERFSRTTAAIFDCISYLRRRWSRLLPIPRFVPIESHRRLRNAMRYLDDHIYSIALGRAPRPREQTLLTDLMATRDAKSGLGMQPLHLRDEVMTMCVAGQVTTGNALSWAMYVLSVNPQCRRALIEEIDRVLGSAAPTRATLEKLSLMERVVNETLRMYPPIWMFTRRSILDGVLNGVEVPAGSELLISPYVIHRHPDYWDRPDVFDPNRFLPAAAAVRHTYAFLPFNHGRRTCTGGHFAVTEIKVILTRVLQHVLLDMPEGIKAEMHPQMTLNVRGGLKMIIHRSGR